MIRDHDRRAGPGLPALHAGQRVTILNKESHQWSRATSALNAPCHVRRPYIVQTPNGTRLRKTRSELRELRADNILTEATERTRQQMTFRQCNTDEQQVTPPITTFGKPPLGETMSLAPAIRRSGRMILNPSRFQEFRTISVSGIYIKGLLVLAAFTF